MTCVFGKAETRKDTPGSHRTRPRDECAQVSVSAQGDIRPDSADNDAENPSGRRLWKQGGLGQLLRQHMKEQERTMNA